MVDKVFKLFHNKRNNQINLVLKRKDFPELKSKQPKFLRVKDGNYDFYDDNSCED